MVLSVAQFCIPRTVSKLEFRLRQSPGVRATQRGPYCINTDLFAIDRTAGAYRLSPNSNFLTARGIALNDAAETWDKYWQSIFVKVRLKISHRKDLSEVERHYAYWLLKGYSQFSAMMQGKRPEPPFVTEDLLRRHVAGYVRRLTRQCKGKPPAVKKARSVRFDPTF